MHIRYILFIYLFSMALILPTKILQLFSFHFFFFSLYFFLHDCFVYYNKKEKKVIDASGSSCKIFSPCRK